MLRDELDVLVVPVDAGTAQFVARTLAGDTFGTAAASAHGVHPPFDLGMALSLLLRHRAGSLDAAVGELRARNIKLKHADGTVGLPEFAPFDGILVTAAVTQIPPPLVQQLKPGGRLLVLEFSQIAAPLRKATELNARPSATYADKLAATEALLRQAATDFTTPDGQVQVVQAHSLGAEDVVVAHILQRLNLPIAAFVLETGALHAETLALLERTRQAQPERLRVYQPQAEAVVQFVQRHGADAMYQSIELRKACCGVRKMEPLARMLAPRSAWVTGLRREQSANRAEVPFDEDDGQGRRKISPIADWTWAEVWAYVEQYGVPYNPLHDQFMPSIGCAPCTRACSRASARSCTTHASRRTSSSPRSVRRCRTSSRPRRGKETPTSGSTAVPATTS